MRISNHPVILSLVCASSLVGAAACGSSTSSTGAGASNGSSSGSASTGGSKASSSSSGEASSGSSSSGDAGTGGAAPVGPGASLSCTSSSKNAYETYGQSAFFAVTAEIFTLVGQEISANGTKNLGTSFGLVGSGNPPSTTDDAAVFQGKLAAFLVWAYGGPSSITYTDNNVYDGANQSMVAAHTGLAITNDQYTYFLTNIVVPALTNKGVPMGDVSSCFAPVVSDATFVASIVGH
jgi:hypothetical protein